MTRRRKRGKKTRTTKQHDPGFIGYSARIREFTRSEQNIIPLLAKGLSNKEIGNALFVAEQTIKNHVYRMKRKLGAVSRQNIIDRYAHFEGRRRMDTTTFKELDSCFYQCEVCKAEFEFSDMNDPDDHAPLFCPLCGRAKETGAAVLTPAAET
jgi:DNA-binding CsgD family transcriptional regulator